MAGKKTEDDRWEMPGAVKTGLKIATGVVVVAGAYKVGEVKGAKKTLIAVGADPKMLK